VFFLLSLNERKDSNSFTHEKPDSNARSISESRSNRVKIQSENHVERIESIDEKKSLQDIINNSDDAQRRHEIRDHCREWALQDLPKCLAWAKSLENADDRAVALMGITFALLQGDQMQESQAYDIINTIPKGNVKDMVIVSCFDRSLTLNPDNAMKLAESLSESSAIAFVAGKLAKSPYGSASVEKIMREHDMGAFRNAFAAAYVEHLTSTEPSLALDWLKDNQDFDGVGVSYALVGSALAKNDPLRAISMCSSVSDKNLQRSMLSQIALQWADSKPSVAGNWFIKEINNNSKVAERISNEIISTWIQRDNEEPFRAIEQISDPLRRLEIKSEAISALAHTDGKGATLKILNDGTIPLANKVSVMEVVMNNWLHQNSTEASKWVIDLPAGVVKDRAVQSILEEVIEVDKDYQSAFLWAQEIGDTNLRDKILKKYEVKIQESNR
jgi:hypothetical protein